MDFAAPRLPRARYVSVPDAGHAIAGERPGRFTAALLEFLRAA